MIINSPFRIAVPPWSSTTRTSSSSGRRVLPGIWKLNTTDFIVRAQPIDPRTGKKKNVRRVLTDASLNDAVLLRDQLMRQPDVEPSRETRRERLGEFATWWLDHKVGRGDIEPSTVDRYQTVIGHLTLRLRDTYLDCVTPTDIEEWIVTATRPSGDSPGYGPATVNGWLRVMRTLLTDAVRLRGIPTNPALAVRSLRVPTNFEDSNTPTLRELRGVLVTLDDDADYVAATALMLQAFTGLRWGETTALKWEDLDGDRGVLWVPRKVQKGQLVPSTKTNRARRVGVPSYLETRLDAFRRRLVAEQHPGLPSGLMFPSSVGKPLWSARASGVLRGACERAGLDRPFTTHGFRRSMTDLLREAAVDPVTAKAITGHTTDAMREHYSTVRAADVRAAGERVARLIQTPS
ncbi:MAG: site-specific integrase [Sandaracinaceae bacterium]|nr:site-specific integrase [Sandaracinaceae bacterium]